MKVTIFSDGSILKPNPGGPGGFAAVVLAGITTVDRPVHLPDLLDVAEGHELSSTNQRMEMMGAIHGLLAALKRGATEALLVSDSEYVTKGLSEWLPGWKARDWHTSSGTPVKNLDLWQALDELAHEHGLNVRVQHVRGHQGNPWNEYCDQLAGKQSALAKQHRQETA